MAIPMLIEEEHGSAVITPKHLHNGYWSGNTSYTGRLAQTDPIAAMQNLTASPDHGHSIHKQTIYRTAEP